MKKSPDYKDEKDRSVDKERGPSIFPPLGFDDDPADVYADEIHTLVEGRITLDSLFVPD